MLSRRYSHKRAQIKPKLLRINKPLDRSSFTVKARQELINNKWIERYTGRRTKPKPIGPPDSFSAIKVIGRKYKLVKSILRAMIRLAVFILQFLAKHK
jgi:hypothetical protein